MHQINGLKTLSQRANNTVAIDFEHFNFLFYLMRALHTGQSACTFRKPCFYTVTFITVLFHEIAIYLSMEDF